MEELVAKAKSGDETAFNDLIISIEQDLYKIAKMRLKNEEDINDAVQETIIHAYKYIKKIKDPKYFKSWIIRILINNCNTIYKKVCKEKKAEYIEEINLKSCMDNEELIENLDFHILIKTLNYREKITLTLFYLSDFTTKEIAKILKEPENTIKSRLSRSKAKLKKICYGDDFHGKNRV